MMRCSDTRVRRLHGWQPLVFRAAEKEPGPLEAVPDMAHTLSRQPLKPGIGS